MAPTNATWNGQDSQSNPLRWGTPGLTWNGLIPEPQTSKRMPQLRVLLGFGNMADHTLSLSLPNNPPQNFEVQPIADKVDELINALRR